MNLKTPTQLPLGESAERPSLERKPNPHERTDVREAVRAPRLFGKTRIVTNIPRATTPEKQCKNGDCKRQIYRTRFCFRCWAGIKWTSMHQRLENVTGHNPSYVRTPLGFTRKTFVQWVLDNPPPTEMEKPSIDRIIPSLGYAPGNIRWLEMRKNCAGTQRDIPKHERLCLGCGTVKTLNSANFHRNGKGFQHRCIPCRLIYDKQWR